MHTRLEKQADAAAEENQRLAIASLSSQQLKAQEIRARMSGNIPGYMPQKQGGAAEPVQFSVVFNFDGGRTEKITMIDGRADEAMPALPESSSDPDQVIEEDV